MSDAQRLSWSTSRVVLGMSFDFELPSILIVVRAMTKTALGGQRGHRHDTNDLRSGRWTIVQADLAVSAAMEADVPTVRR